MRILLVFIDGLGLGEDNAEVNPLVRFNPDCFRRLFGHSLTSKLGVILASDYCLIPTDAVLGVEGLPQSATGQTALFTGVNAPLLMGRHIVGFPGPQLAAIIEAQGLMARIKKLGHTVTSANMYAPNYFALVASRKRRHAVTTLTILGAGENLRSVEELSLGQAVYQDITNETLPLLKVTGIPVITPELAAERLLALTRHYDFTMFEYFQTDRCGHKRDWSYAQKILRNLDAFLGIIFANCPADTLVIVTSDHGNFEDFSVKTHTKNLVPTILVGERCRDFALKIRNLTDIAPAIISVFEEMSVSG